MGMGPGITQQLTYSIAAAKIARHEIPAAIGFINIAQIGSMVIAVTALTISVTVFQNIAFHKL